MDNERHSRDISRGITVTPTFDSSLFGLLPSKSDVVIPEEAKTALAPEDVAGLESSGKENIGRILQMLGLVGALFNPAALGLVGAGAGFNRGVRSSKEKIIKDALELAQSRSTQKLQEREATRLEKGVDLRTRELDLSERQTAESEKAGELSRTAVPSFGLEELGLVTQEGAQLFPGITYSQLDAIAPFLKPPKDPVLSDIGKYQGEREALRAAREAKSAIRDIYIKSQAGVEDTDRNLAKFDKDIKSIDSRLKEYDAIIEKSISSSTGDVGGRTVEFIINKISKSGAGSLTEGEKQALAIAHKEDLNVANMAVELASADLQFQVSSSPAEKDEILSRYMGIAKAIISGGEIPAMPKEPEPEGFLEGLKKKIFPGNKVPQSGSTNEKGDEALMSQLPPASGYKDKIIKHKASGKRFKSDGIQWKRIE